MDVLPRSTPDETQYRRAEHVQGFEGLPVGEGLVVHRAPAAAQGRREAATLHPARGGEAQEIEERGHQVDGCDELVGHDALGDARPADDERHPDGGVVDEEGAGRLSVFSETLAVVAQHHEQGVLQGVPTLTHHLKDAIQNAVEVLFDVSTFYDVATAEKKESLDGVLQLSDVAGPTILLELLNGLLAETLGSQVSLLRQTLGEERNEMRDLFRTLPQGRNG